MFCATLSYWVGIPSGRLVPSGFGMYFLLVGIGLHFSWFKSRLRLSIIFDTCRWLVSLFLILSTPAVFLPLFCWASLYSEGILLYWLFFISSWNLFIFFNLHSLTALNSCVCNSCTCLAVCLIRPLVKLFLFLVSEVLNLLPLRIYVLNQIFNNYFGNFLASLPSLIPLGFSVSISLNIVMIPFYTYFCASVNSESTCYNFGRP